jgi:hypothetical protein
VYGVTSIVTIIFLYSHHHHYHYHQHHFHDYRTMDVETDAQREPHHKRPRLEDAWKFFVPTLDFGRLDHQTYSITEMYQNHQVVHLLGYLQYIQQESRRERQNGESTDEHIENEGQATTGNLRWNDLYDIFTGLSAKDKDSFCYENSSSVEASSPEFLQCKDWNVGYCSFLVQDQEYLSRLTKRLPVRSLDDGSSCSGISIRTRNDSSTASCVCCRCWNYEPCLWIFFGRNPSLINGEKKTIRDLQGRTEHTDSISHDGTWHYQLSGIKRWLLRPTSQLWNQLLKRGELPETPIVIDCNQGDVLIVNTRLWYHQTLLPPQPQPSVSYARDFWIKRSATGAVGPERCGGIVTRMTNVDGLYATDNISEGTILFREEEMPDCELHRSVTDPNCEVVELEDGTHAVVSIRRILAGEFFCVGESSDEDDAVEE